MPRRAPDSVPSSDDSLALASNLLASEYALVHEDLHRAFGFAQTIIGWSFTAFGVTLGAGLLAASQSPRDDFLDWAVMLLFGLFAPALIWSAALSWLGELVRVERSAAYLRGLETQIEKIPGLKAWGFAPLRYYRTVRTSSTKNVAGRQPYSYLGTAAAFFGASLLSLGLFAMRWGAVGDPFHETWHVVVGAGAIAIEIGGTVASFIAGRRLWRTHTHDVPLG